MTILMCGIARLSIVETQQELEDMLRKQKNPKLKERIQALYLLKVGQIPNVMQTAKALGRHRATVQRWLAAYRLGGMEAMLELKISPAKESGSY